MHCRLTNHCSIENPLKEHSDFFRTSSYSAYPSEIDKSIHTLFISVHTVTLSEAPTASLA